MSTIIQPKGKVYLYQKQFDTLVKQQKLETGIEYCIIDNKIIFTEYIYASDWTTIENTSGFYSYRAISENVYSQYNEVDLKGTFEVGNYGITMFELDEDGKIVFFAMNKPTKDIILKLEVNK